MSNRRYISIIQLVKEVFSLLLFLVPATANYAQDQNKQSKYRNWNDTLAMIEKLLAVYQPPNPGYELSISRSGVTIFSKAGGMADLEHQGKMTTHSIIEAGSVSKQITAAAILLLEQQGKLSLEDDVRKYIPELPDYKTPVRLRHLMHHTSGIRDWGVIAGLAGWPRGTRAYNNDDALEIICRQQELNNKPGDEFIYSNSNYNLFAIIVSRVSGMSLAAFTKKYIFKPAGMLNTSWRDDYKRVLPNRAIAYSKTSDGYQTDMPNENAYGNGGLLTTTEDLLKWQQFYLSGELGGPSFLKKQTTAGTFTNRLLNNYGAGLFLGKKEGWDNIMHDGATAGYRAYLETFPQLKLSIAFLSNTSEFDEEAIIAGIENIFVKDIDADENKQIPSIPVPSDSLQKLSGLYRNNRTGDALRISIKGDTLISGNDGALRAVSHHNFQIKNVQLVFDANGMNYIIPSDTIRYSRVNPARSDTQSINAYPGQYFAEELQATVSIALKNNVLILHLSPQQEFSLAPTYEDGLIVTNMGVNLLFERDNNGQVIGMKANTYRVRNLKFVKLKNN